MPSVLAKVRIDSIGVLDRVDEARRALRFFVIRGRSFIHGSRRAPAPALRIVLRLKPLTPDIEPDW
jgi:hypothetical protein